MYAVLMWLLVSCLSNRICCDNLCFSKGNIFAHMLYHSYIFSGVEEERRNHFPLEKSPLER